MHRLDSRGLKPSRYEAALHSRGLKPSRYEAARYGLVIALGLALCAPAINAERPAPKRTQIAERISLIGTYTAFTTS